jgi:hypothetical protein
MQTNFVLLLVGAAALIFGLYWSYKTYTIYRKITASQNWQVASGKVTEATTRYTSGRGSNKHYLAEFKYSFSVVGSDFTGGFKMDSFLGQASVAHKNVEEHSVGSSVTVRYNPENPKECVSEYDKVTSSDVLTSLILIVLGAVCIFLSF